MVSPQAKPKDCISDRARIYILNNPWYPSVWERRAAAAGLFPGANVIRKEPMEMSGNQNRALSVHADAGASQAPHVWAKLCKVRSTVTCAKDYSYLNATMGSTHVARRAGT